MRSRSPAKEWALFIVWASEKQQKKELFNTAQEKKHPGCFTGVRLKYPHLCFFLISVWKRRIVTCFDWFPLGFWSCFMVPSWWALLYISAKERASQVTPPSQKPQHILCYSQPISQLPPQSTECVWLCLKRRYLRGKSCHSRCCGQTWPLPGEIKTDKYWKSRLFKLLSLIVSWNKTFSQFEYFDLIMYNQAKELYCHFSLKIILSSIFSFCMWNKFKDWGKC